MACRLAVHHHYHQGRLNGWLACMMQVRDEASLPWCVVYYCPSHGSEAPGVPLPNPRFRYLDDKLEIWEAGRVRRAKQQEEDDDDTEDEDEERHTNARG